MSEDLPVSPLSAAAQAAALMHEVFEAYKAAGFSEQQALYLVACHACGGPKEPQ